MNSAEPEDGQVPDWAAAIAAAQQLPPALESVALQAQADRRAEIAAKFTLRTPREK